MRQKILPGIEDLPVFEEHPFGRKTAPPVYELALITSKVVPATTPPYRFQKAVGVVGTTPARDRIYFSFESRIREDGTALASDNNYGETDIENIEYYEVLRSHDRMSELKSTRRLK